MENLLMIFMKNPVPGKVKTRLAATMGDKKALEIYLKLTEHTLNITEKLNCDKIIFYSDIIPPNHTGRGSKYITALQSGDDLGERMLHAFQTAFQQKYKKVMIIGSDCFDLTSELIEQGFSLLDNRDIVIGPARDGGYYLLGKKKLFPGLFKNKSWSTGTVFSQTISDCAAAGKSLALLPVLTDIDEEKDLPLDFLNRSNIATAEI